MQPVKPPALDLHKETADSKRNAAWLLLGIILIAANLRTPLTSISPLLDLIRLDIPMSNTMAGFLTTLPLLAFAALSPFVPKLARRFGIEHVVFASTIVMLAGSLIRQVGSESGLLIGTLLTGLGIAVGNVVLPSLIKKEFPYRMGLMTGIYSISMNVFAALGSATSVPIANSTAFHWRGTMLTITFISLLALIIWLPQLRYNDKAVQTSAVAKAKQSVWRSGLAWKITLFMGLQSFIFYIFVAWLPNMLLDRGMSNEQSGFMLSVLQIGIIPSTFIIPIVASRLKNQISLVIGVFILYFLGFAGLIFAPNVVFITTISVLLIGIASGTTFSLAMMFFNLRTRTTQEAAEISGMAQSIGYLLAATGPFLFGAFHDAVGSWIIPMILLIVAAVVLLIVGISPARGKSYIFRE